VDDHLLNAFFRARLLPYVHVVIVNVERGTLIQHLKVVVICEENSTNACGNRVILDIYPMMKGKKKGKKNANQQC
jgi:hypothetical protein